MVYWNHSPTPDFVGRFNAVARRGGIEFEAWFNTRREAYRSWDVDEREWLFPARYIPERSIFGWRQRVPVAELLQSRPDLLVQEYDRSHLTAGFFAGRRLAGRTAFRVLPNFDSWSDRTWWRAAGKHFVFRAVDGAKVPGADGKALAERYGLSADRIASVTQSVDYERLAVDAERGRRFRTPRREELGLKGCVFIYVGRLWSGKGTDHLIAAYGALLAEGRDVSLLMLGDGPDEHRYRAASNSMPGVVFAGFVQAREIADYYGIADVMVFPTLGDPHGLVIEEAMAAGLPVISSAAAGDVAARLGRGSAGLIVDPGETQALHIAMRTLADDPNRRASMANRARELARERDHTRYAEEFERFVLDTLARPRRGTLAARAAGINGWLLTVGAQRHESAAMVPAIPGRDTVDQRSGATKEAPVRVAKERSSSDDH